MPRLVTDVATRWNSAFDMIEHFLEQQAAVTAALLSPDVRKREKDIGTFTESDILNAEEFVQELKPLNKVAMCGRVCSGIEATSGGYVRYIRRGTSNTFCNSPFTRTDRFSKHSRKILETLLLSAK